MSTRSREEIEAEVEDLAMGVVQEMDPTLSIEAARSAVYEEAPELYEEYLASPPTPPSLPISKAEREPTLAEEIHAVVRKKAGDLAWTKWPNKTIEDLEWEVWSSPEGQLLYWLQSSPDGRLPMSEVQHRITKSAYTSDAWRVFASWRAG